MEAHHTVGNEEVIAGPGEDLIPEMHQAPAISAVLATRSDFIRTKCCVPSIRKISL
jgi:hypothetical protein